MIFSKLSIAFVLFICVNFVFAQNPQVIEQKIDSIFASYNSHTPGAAVAVVKDGKIVFMKGYGMANLSYDIPITPQTVFNIASVSKQFTAFAIYLLENEGKLSFEDDVRKYIPELPDYDTTIKIKHLLGHTSGLADHGALASIAGTYINADFNNTELNLKILSKHNTLNFVPGSMFGYCNSNYTLLAEIIHRVTGKTFSEFTKEKIFIPLGMTNTQFSDNFQKVVKNLAESYELENNSYFIKPLVESNPGPSNLLTTVEDLCKWVLNFEKPIVGNSQLIKAFNEPSYLDNGNKVILRVTENDTIFHAKGQNVSKLKGNYLGHGGHTAGFRTFLGRYPDHRLSIIQLSNDEHNENLGGRWDIADFYIKTPPVQNIQPTVTIPNNIQAKAPTPNYTVGLEEFTGKYFNEALETNYHFEVKDNKLLMKNSRLSDITLKRVGDTKFTGYGSYTFPFEIDFLNNKKGEITGFKISNWGVKNVVFERK